MSTDITFFKLWKKLQDIDSEIILDSPSLILRTASTTDIKELAHLLTVSFHPADEWMEILHPILRFGIYEDLRSRIHNPPPHHACIVACNSGGLNASLSQKNDLETPQPILETAPRDLREDGKPSTATLQARPASRRGNYQSLPIIGTVEVTVKRQPFSFAGSRYAYISNLATHPRHRRRGVARHLLEGCEHVAQQWGFNTIYLHVLENNTHAQRLYSRLGYTVKQAETGLATWLLGQPKQLLLMKTLSYSGVQMN
jgi:ribosomal protein S18 acetylase RimI-like enzyme